MLLDLAPFVVEGLALAPPSGCRLIHEVVELVHADVDAVHTVVDDNILVSIIAVCSLLVTSSSMQALFSTDKLDFDPWRYSAESPQSRCPAKLNPITRDNVSASVIGE